MIDRYSNVCNNLGSLYRSITHIDVDFFDGSVRSVAKMR